MILEDIMDQTNQFNTDEKEINLVELIAYVVRKGRAIIVWAIVFMLLLGAYKGRTLIGTLTGSLDSAEESTDYQDELDLYNSQKEADETQIDNLSAQIEAQQEYKKNSILMNINPYSEYRDVTSYYIVTDYQIMPGMDYQNVDPVPSLLKAYQNIIGGNEVYEAVSDKIDREASLWSIEELISVDTDLSSNLNNYAGVRVFTVTTVGDTKELADTLMEAVQNQIESHQEEIASTVAAHELRVIQTSSELTVDNNLLTKLTNFSNNITKLQQSLADTQENLNELEEPVATAAGSRRAAVKSILKYAILGLFVGIFLSAFWYAVQYVMRDPIADSSDLEDRYRLVVFGKLTPERKEGFFHKISDRMRGINRKKPGIEQQYQMITEYIAGLKNQPEKAAIVSATDSDADRTAAEKIAAGVQNISMQYCGDVTVNADALKDLNQADAVLFLLDMDNVSEKKLQSMIRICRNCGKSIMGTVLSA